MRARLIGGFLSPVLGIALFSTGTTAALAADGARLRNLGEGLEIGAVLSAAQVSNDNFYHQQSDQETKVEGLLVHPALTLKQQFGRGVASLDVGAQIAEFDIPGEFNDYVDSQISGALNYDGGVRSAFELQAASNHGHDLSGLDRAGTDLDKWVTNSFGGNYRYGAPTAMLNLELGVNYSDKDYSNDDLIFLDHDKISLSQLLAVNYSPKTAVLLEFGEDVVDFDLDPATPGVGRDAKELRLRTGLRWKATAKTTGDLRVGATRRTLDDNRARVVDGASWQAKIIWEPLSRTTVTFESFRKSQETVASDTLVVDNRRYSLSYAQGWGRNFRTVLAAGIGSSEFVGASPDRKDDLNNYALSAIYSFRGALSVYADVTRTKRDSTRSDRDFTALAAIIGIRVSP